ncbi:MAG: hypothetical protein AB9869_05740 [Verrucomicrobiia bacterium]
MILERIELWRTGRFVERVKAGPFSPGLNILAAPNEHGKSTLVRAAARCLFDRHTTRADEIRSLQPAGTDLAPEVAVNFAIGQRRFRLRKRFLQNAESALAEWRDASWREMADGDAADQSVFELLMASQPGRGASKPEHWGLLRYLWARQDELALWPEWDNASGERVRRCLAKVEMDPGIDRVLAGVCDESQRVFTPTGQVKKSGELFAAQQQFEKLEAELANTRQRIASVEAEQDRHRLLASELAQLRRSAAENRTEAERLQEQLASLALVRQEIAAAQEQFDRANSRLQEVNLDCQRLAALRQSAEEAGPKQEAVRDRGKQIAAEEEGLQARCRRAAEELARFEQDRQRLGVETARWRALLKWRELEAQVAASRGKRLRIDALTGELAAKERARTLVPTLTPKQIESLRTLDREVRDLEIQLRSAGLEIELAPATPVAVRAETERGTVELPAAQEAPAVIHAHRRARIDLPGWGIVTITSGARELKDLEARLAGATEALAQLREKLGVPSVEKGEEFLHLGKDLDREIKGLRKHLQELLDAHESAQAFVNSVSALEARLADMARRLEPLVPQEQILGAADLEARVSASEAAVQALEKRLRHASIERQELERCINDLLRERGDVLTRSAVIKGELERARAQMHSLEQRYSEGLEGARAAAQQAFVQAEARLTVSKAKLPADADRLPERRDRAMRAAADAEQSCHLKSAEMNRLEGALGTTAAAGLFSHATDLEEQVALVRARMQALRRRAQAARFLEALIQRRKAAAVRTVLAPLEKRLSATFAELTGEQRREVFLNESLAILGVGRTRDARELVPFESLSQGAKEQLLLCLRAAAAVELAAAEPQTLILDDVLVNTDPIRQTRVLDFLAQLAQRVQVIVLTCHPERYAGVGQRVSITPVGPGE